MIGSTSCSGSLITGLTKSFLVGCFRPIQLKGVCLARGAPAVEATLGPPGQCLSTKRLGHRNEVDQEQVCRLGVGLGTQVSCFEASPSGRCPS